MKTESQNGALPLEDGEYLGSWLRYRVTIPFDGFDVSFLTHEMAPVRETRSGAIQCKVSVTDGIAIVEAK